MTAQLLELVGWAPEVMARFFLVFLRVGAAMFVLPVFGDNMIPLRIRLGVALTFAFIAFPGVDLPPDLADGSGPAVLLAGLSEVLTGLLIGLLLRFHVMAIQIAASIAAQATSLAQLLGNNSIDPQPALGLVLYLGALALAVELGLHVQLAKMFMASYMQIGMGELIGPGAAGALRDAVSVTFRFGFVLAAPFIAASLLYNLGLGVINRAMPQLMVAFVGAPAITLGALVLLALCAPLILTIWVEGFQHLLNSPFGGER